MQRSVGKKVQRRGSLFVVTSESFRIMQQDYPQGFSYTPQSLSNDYYHNRNRQVYDYCVLDPYGKSSSTKYPHTNPKHDNLHSGHPPQTVWQAWSLWPEKELLGSSMQRKKGSRFQPEG